MLTSAGRAGDLYGLFAWWRFSIIFVSQECNFMTLGQLPKNVIDHQLHILIRGCFQRGDLSTNSGAGNNIVVSAFEVMMMMIMMMMYTNNTLFCPCRWDAIGVRYIEMYSDVSRLLLLLLLMMIMMTLMLTMTQSRSSEDVQLPQRIPHGDDSELEDLKPFEVALTAPPRALPPNVARLAAEQAADAAAIRQEAAKTKQKLWQKAKQAHMKKKQGHPQTHTEQDEQEDKKTEKESKEEDRMKMGQQKKHHKHHRGNENSQDSSTVNNTSSLNKFE